MHLKQFDPVAATTLLAGLDRGLPFDTAACAAGVTPAQALEWIAAGHVPGSHRARFVARARAHLIEAGRRWARRGPRSEPGRPAGRGDSRPRADAPG